MHLGRMGDGHGYQDDAVFGTLESFDRVDVQCLQFLVVADQMPDQSDLSAPGGYHAHAAGIKFMAQGGADVFNEGDDALGFDAMEPGALRPWARHEDGASGRKQGMPDRIIRTVEQMFCFLFRPAADQSMSVPGIDDLCDIIMHPEMGGEHAVCVIPAITPRRFHEPFEE